MSRLILYPGALRSEDLSGTDIIKALSVSPTIKQWTFTPQPTLVTADAFQMDCETNNPELEGFIPEGVIMGVVNADNAIQTLFENTAGAATYFQIAASDTFKVNFFDGGEIDTDIPFSWSGRQTIAFILSYQTSYIYFYLYYGGVVYEFRRFIETPSTADRDLMLKSGRWERLERFSGVPADITETFQYLLRGTSLSGSDVTLLSGYEAYKLIVEILGQINDTQKTSDWFDLGFSGSHFAGFAGVKITDVGGRDLIDTLYNLDGANAKFTGNNRPELFGNSIVVEKASTNLFLNSATLSTQGVTVTADPYTVSIEGTGSITFSGVHTGTLQGVGGQRVSVAFTPTAGTLTCTVSGTVTKAQIEQSAYATLYIPTEGTSVTRVAPNPNISNTLPDVGSTWVVCDAVEASGKATYIFSGGSFTWFHNRAFTSVNNNGIQCVIRDSSLRSVIVPLVIGRNKFAVLLTKNSTNFKFWVLFGTSIYTSASQTVGTGSSTNSIRLGKGNTNNSNDESLYTEALGSDGVDRMNATDEQIKEMFEMITFGTSIQTTADEMTIV